MDYVIYGLASFGTVVGFFGICYLIGKWNRKRIEHEWEHREINRRIKWLEERR